MKRAAALVAVLLLAGCVGAVDRAQFDEEIRARGGGFDQSFVIEAVESVAAEVGTTDFDITGLSVAPAAAVVTMQVRDPRSPDQLDDYTFRAGSLESVEPVAVGASDDLDAETFPISEFALDSLNGMVDEALAEYGTEGGYVDQVAFLGLPTGESPGIRVGLVRVSLQSARSAATAQFTADGGFLGLERE